MRTYVHLFRLISFYHIRHHPLRTLLSLSVMALGVAMLLLGIANLPNDDRALAAGVDIFSGRAALTIQADGGELDAGHLAAVRQTQGVEEAAPLSMGGGLILGQGELLMFWGIDPQADPAVRDYALVQGEFLSGPGGLLLAENYVQEKGYQLGQTITLLGPGGLRPLTLVGTLAGEGIGLLNSGDLAVLSLEDAEAIRGSEAIDSIAVVVAEGQDLTALMERLRALVPAETEVTDPRAAFRAGPEAFVADAMIAIVSLIPAGLGALIIFNTQAASVAQRRREIGILRALGVTTRSTRNLFLVESATMGVVASAVGVVLGSIIPFKIPQDSLSALSAPVETSVQPGTALLAFALGTGVALLAGLIPARKAARVDPVEAMLRPCLDAGTVRISIMRAAIGIVLISSAFVLRLALDNTPGAAMLLMTGSFLPMIGATLLCPVVLILLVRVLPGMFGRFFGVTGKLAVESLARRPQRMAAVSMMIYLVVSFCGFATGTEQGSAGYVRDWLERESTWELTIAGAGTGPNSPMTFIPADVVAEIADRPAVAAVIQERLTPLSYGEGEYTIRALDLGTYYAKGGRLTLESGDEAGVYARLQDGNHPGLLVGGMQALSDGLMRLGSTVTLDTPSGPVAFEVVGTVPLLGVAVDSNDGLLVMDRALYRQLWNDDRVDRLLIDLRPGADVQAERRDLLLRYAMQGLVVADQAAVSAAIENANQGAGALSYVLLPLMMMGIANTLFIAVLDRQREIGLLRAVGTLRRQVTGSIILETTILVALVSLFAIPMAFYAMEMMLFGRVTSIPLKPDVIGMAQFAMLVLITGALAAYLPARRAGRTNILEAMRYE